MLLTMQVPVLTLAVAFILTAPLRADTTYTYTGNDFTTITGAGLTTSDSVTGSFTLASALGDNLNGNNIAASTLSFSFTDGPDTITNSTPGVDTCNCSPVIDIWTDGSGNIVNWDVAVTVGELGSETILTQDYFAGIFTGTLIRDLGNLDNTGDNTAENLGDAGTWTTGSTSATPEPGSLWLLGAGLAALTGAIRRKSSARAVSQEITGPPASWVHAASAAFILPHVPSEP